MDSFINSIRGHVYHFLGDLNVLTADQLSEIIVKTIPGAQIRAMDMTGGGDHWQLRIRAPEFEGLSMIEQHQLVYKALGDLMQSKIHALSLDTGVLEKT